MAIMIPPQIDESKPDGEKKFYRFLESVAKPDQKFTIWYLPHVEGREPDFILFCDEIGLIIFEVKDWVLQQIVEASSDEFKLMMGHKEERRKNPLRQALEYSRSLLDRFKHDGRLLSKDPVYYGKAKLPIDCGVVFPHINKYEYQQKGLDKVISPNKAFFEDDLHLASDICSDASGGCFRKALLGMFPPKFRFKLLGAEYAHLKQLLFPVVRIEQAERDTCAYIDPVHRIDVLDDHQEAIARNCCSGYHVIRGPSGSGKTLILVHKAAFLRHYRPEIKSILFLCYNITLVNFIKRLLTRKGVALGSGGVEVYPFHELCAMILEEKIDYEKEGSDYYQLLEEETLTRLQKEKRQYDAVLVDEGQDFSKEMGQIIFSLVDSETPNLTVAVDEGQNIYDRDALWHPPSRDKFRTDDISGMYRNSVEIRQFALAFLKKRKKNDPQGHPVYCETRGPKPELRQFKDFDHILSFVADTIKKLHDQREYPLSEFAVLYTKRSLGPDGKVSAPELLMATLESRSIMSQWVSEDYRAKRAYDITTDKVSISTIHSAKGLDYGCVILLGLDGLQAIGSSEEQIRKLVYVGITRGRHRLLIPFYQRTALISELISCI